MIKTFKYRLYPTKAQRFKLERVLTLCRWLYNAALEQRIIAYKSHGKSLNYYDQANELPMLDKEYNDVFSQVKQDVLKRLDKAFKAFFRRLKLKGGKAGFPRFRAEHRFDSFTYPQLGFSLGEDNRVYLSKIGSIRVKLHRSITGKIKTCTIKREVDQWYVMFSCDIPESDIQCVLDETNSVGIDVGLESFAVTSDNEFIDNPRYFRKSEERLAQAQRSLQKKKRGSNKRRKERLRVAKCHRKTKRQREDFQHKVSRYLINRYDVVYMEDLNIRNMLRNHRLAKSISDAGWGQFTSFMVYKAAEAGKQVVFVDPRGTSQRCSQCGAVVTKTLSDRWHDCPACGLSAHRDINSACDIKRIGRGLRGLTREAAAL